MCFLKTQKHIMCFIHAPKHIMCFTFISLKTQNLCFCVYVSVGHETFREKKKVSRKQFRQNKKKKIFSKKIVLAHILAKEKSFRENTRQKIRFREPFLFSRKRYLPTLNLILFSRVPPRF